MRITRFWIVTKPNVLSTIDDICFETDMIGLEKQFKGGLKAEDIFGTYTEESQAKKDSRTLLGLPEEQEDSCYENSDCEEVCFCQHGIRPEDCNICRPETGWM